MDGDIIKMTLEEWNKLEKGEKGTIQGRRYAFVVHGANSFCKWVVIEGEEDPIPSWIENRWTH